MLIYGYFYIHNRMLSALFDTIEDAEKSAEHILNQSQHEVTFYSLTGRNNNRFTVAYVQRWSSKE